jgi:hypothetical protein
VLDGDGAVVCWVGLIIWLVNDGAVVCGVGLIVCVGC